MTIKEFKIQLALGSLTDNMKWNLAENKRISKEVLTILSKDKNIDVRSSVAYNSNTPKEVLKKLSKDESWDVRSSVAYNSNTPKEVLTILSKDKSSIISNAAIDELSERLKK